MQQISYRVLNFDLATPRGRGSAPVVEIGTPYDSIAVLAIPAAAVAFLHLGTNGDNIPLAAQMTLNLEGVEGGPDPTDVGLYLTNPVGAGILTLLVSLSGMKRG